MSLRCGPASKTGLKYNENVRKNLENFWNLNFKRIKFKMIHSSKYLSSVVQFYLYQKGFEVHQFKSFCLNPKYNI